MSGSETLSDDEKPRCSEERCERIAKKRGLCGPCYQRRKRAGTLPTEWKMARPARDAVPVKCCVEGCPEPAQGRGRCNRHYKQWRRAQARAFRQAEAERRSDEKPAKLPLDDELEAKCRRESFGPLMSWEKHPIPWD